MERHPPTERDSELSKGSFQPALWLERFRERLDTVPFTRFDSGIALLVAILAYMAVTLHSASHHLWHDELYTYYIAKAPSVSQLLQWIQLDLNPPLSYLLTRASLASLGNSALATRFPFIVAFLIGSLCLYRFVSQRLRPAYGLLAMLVFWSTPLFSYATEARPYALVIAFFGIAMLAWQRAVQPDRSKSSVLILGLAVLGMMFSHFFSVFYILPFCLAELWRWYRSRKLDWAIWAALLLPCLVPLFYLSQVHRYEGSALPPVMQASPFKAVAFFYHTLEPEGILLLIAICCAMAAVFRRERIRTDARTLMTPLELAFTFGLLAIPIALNLILMRTHGAFYPRYGIPALFAYGLLLSFFLAMYTNVSRLAAGIACGVLLLALVGTTAVEAGLDKLRSWGKKPAVTIRSSPLENIRPDLPLVVAGGLTFVEMNTYESPATLARLYYLNDRDLAIRYAHATIFEGLPSIRDVFHFRGHLAPYRQFVADHPHFLVLGTPDYQEEWLIRRLLDIHASLRYLGNLSIPYWDTQLYEVTMPGAS